MNIPVKNVPLGEALVEDGALTRQQLQRALSEQKSSGTMLGELLVDQGVIQSGTLVRVLARQFGIRGCHLRHGLIDPELMSMIGPEEAERLRAIPMFKVRDTLTVAMAEPQSLPKIDRLCQLTGCKIRPVMALEANIVEFVKKYAEGGNDIDEFLASLSEEQVDVVERESVDEGPETNLDRMIEGSPIVNLVNMSLMTSIRDGASDIHIEPDKKGTRIRYRIDGKLRDLMKPPSGLHAAIISRLKVIGKMDIAEKRLPQEGRVRIMAEGRGIDLRVSSMPTLLGEKVVIRILDKSNLHTRMETLGFRTQALDAFQRMLHQPHGLVLVTGPTGSGKTTTLYSALYMLRDPDKNIVTVEDPVEYQMDMVNQIQVQDQIGMSFARALRSILRQDPDVIMVGEIRDEETARVAVQAGLTGHLVLATLHTNDAPGAVARLLDMNVEPYLLSSVLNGVVAQRLARTVCPNCQTKYYPTENVLADAGLCEMTGRPFTKGAGCEACHNSGFRGRAGIYEVMEVTPPIRRLVHCAAAAHELRDKLRDKGQMSLREEGVQIAIDGRSTLEEVLNVTHSEADEPAAPAPAPAEKTADDQAETAEESAQAPLEQVT